MVSNHSPTVSVLITTYNRANLLPRAIRSVLGQSFKDLELVIIDDCSTDSTPAVVKSFKDKRIKYFRNTKNIGAALGDRAHMRRFVYELMKGKFFIYLCDDDYILSPSLIQRQVTAFRMYHNLAMVIGGQLSHFITDEDSLFGGTYENPRSFNIQSLRPYFDFATLQSKSCHFHFMSSTKTNKSLFENYFMTSKEYLADYATDPISKTIIAGGTMYSRAKFISSGGFRSEKGSQWQAGYELLMGPPCVGDVVYLNEPTVLTEIRPENASFQRTQLDHFLDSLHSVDVALQTPIESSKRILKKKFILKTKKITCRNIARAYLRNSLTNKRVGKISMCSEFNISRSVTSWDVIRALWDRNALFQLRKTDIELMFANILPVWLLRQNNIDQFYYRLKKSHQR